MILARLIMISMHIYINPPCTISDSDNSFEKTCTLESIFNTIQLYNLTIPIFRNAFNAMESGSNATLYTQELVLFYTLCCPISCNQIDAAAFEQLVTTLYSITLYHRADYWYILGTQARDFFFDTFFLYNYTSKRFTPIS